MTKILNLDKLDTTSNRVLSIGGVDHKIHEMTVENFIVTTRTVEALSKGTVSVADQVEATLDMILRSVPTLDRASLFGRGLAQLNVIAEFVRGENVDEAEERTDEAGK
ncbi:hypothetical protein QN372_00490 [Undibacterium sp. RTI2.1]|uniref:hypothetical protein n=1 Tax=unclassified Undibacterium TaxID=2630295 RepID=UPI002AB5AB35|nr:MULTISPECIES: hypothetical protein [unclassified Undibacterium]MDY7537616.1 hypothetical protein [Undibacterium sp. 5I1]MEB0029217.1 hypothetical protein [Undibacterium sp. RTI2.1]MEB0115525.1 hypothetical protein [Undibacterium sp. RTI2.2]MEB0230161.1 hypothetical protein [Undibacterium sp. 10I3]MEB0256353.1 hypothetical protein [Undibacterium sp. 5I1]